MKKFTFRLERLMQWRVLELEKEEGRLQLLCADLEQLDTAGRTLDKKAEQAELSVVRADVLVEERQALDGYRRHIANEKQKLARLREDLNVRIAEQRRVLVEAERKVEALTQMRDNKKLEWRSQADKEQEDMVSELVIARWGRRD